MQQTLFLMLGYPGAGKTTTAKVLHKLTGAVHIWADHERSKMFTKPTHEHAENLKLYAHLNEVTNKLLSEGKSVIFDTNFNFYKDREHLRQIAAKHGAKTVVVWVQAPLDLAKERATSTIRNTYTEIMPVAHFERIASNLEPPHDDELTITVESGKITPNYIRTLLSDTL